MGPSQPHVKGNFHASVGKEKSCGVYSLYIAKAKAAKLAAKAIFACKAITRPKPLYIAKAKAAKLAAAKATKLGYKQVICKGDASNLIFFNYRNLLLFLITR